MHEVEAADAVVATLVLCPHQVARGGAQRLVAVGGGGRLHSGTRPVRGQQPPALGKAAAEATGIEEGRSDHR